MANILVLKNARIISVNKIINHGWLVIKNNKIVAIETGQYESQEQVTQIIDCNNKTIIPGFIDSHVHGGYGYSFMDQGQPLAQSLNSFAKAVTAEGVTKFCAATVTASKSVLDKFFIDFGNFMHEKQLEKQAQVVGSYLEGPFISKEYKGAHTESLLVTPNIEWIKKWVKDSYNTLKIVAFAPEIDQNLNNQNNFTQQLLAQKIIPSLAHSGATFEQVEIAIKSGLRHATHLYNGMSPFHHRFPGCVPAILDSKNIIAELICDGVHVDINILKLTYKIKGADNICMVSDAMVAKGCQDGDYWLGPLPVVKHGNMATLKDNDKLLAGSVATMIVGFKNLLQVTNNNWQDCIKMASYNAAKTLKIDRITGDIAVNKLADIVVLDEKNNIFLTICEGKIAFQK